MRTPSLLADRKGKRNTGITYDRLMHRHSSTLEHAQNPYLEHGTASAGLDRHVENVKHRVSICITHKHHPKWSRENYVRGEEWDQPSVSFGTRASENECDHRDGNLRQRGVSQ